MPIADADIAAAARRVPTKDQILAQVQANAEAIVGLYRDRIEAAQGLPGSLRFERLAEIQYTIRDLTNTINRPLVDLLMRLPCDPILMPIAALEKFNAQP